MAQVKLPQITVALNKAHDNVYKKNEEEFEWTQVNPSCLLAYLGIRGFANLGPGINTKTATKNAVPILAYYDIFKNFYANTQEDNFYIILVFRFRNRCMMLSILYFQLIYRYTKLIGSIVTGKR